MGQGGCQDAIVDQGNRRSCTGVQESIVMARNEASSVWRRLRGLEESEDGTMGCRWPLPSIGYDEREGQGLSIAIVGSKDYVHRSTDSKDDLCNIMSTS